MLGNNLFAQNNVLFVIAKERVKRATAAIPCLLRSISGLLPPSLLLELWRTSRCCCSLAMTKENIFCDNKLKMSLRGAKRFTLRSFSEGGSEATRQSRVSCDYLAGCLKTVISSETRNRLKVKIANIRDFSLRYCSVRNDNLSLSLRGAKRFTLCSFSEGGSEATRQSRVCYYHKS